MENASKALLIAASVLIVILLIAFGMKIFNSTSGSASQAEGTMLTTEMSMFNNKFMPYSGKNKSAAQVRSLINLIISSNATSSYRVGIMFDGEYCLILDDMQNAMNNVDPNKNYKITILYGDGAEHAMPTYDNQSGENKIPPLGLVYRAKIDTQ